MEPVSRLQPLGAAGDLRVRLGLAHRRDVGMVLGVIAEVMAAVEDPAGHVGVLVEPAPDGEDGDPDVGPFRLGEHGPGDGGVALAVEGEGDAGAVTRTVVDLDRLPGEAVRGGCGARGRGLRTPGGRRGGGGRSLRRGVDGAAFVRTSHRKDAY